MDKRTLMAILLSVLVLMVFQLWFAPKAPVNISDNVSDNASKMAVKKDVKAVKPVENVVAESNRKGVEKPTDLLEIKTDYLVIKFNKSTGDIYSASVLSYRDKNIGRVEFKDGNEDYFRIDNLRFDKIEYQIKDKGKEKIVEFNCYVGDIVISKIYTIDSKNYLVELNVGITNVGQKSVQLPLNIAIGPNLGEGFDKSRYIFEGPIIFDGKKVYKKRPKKIKEDIVVDKPKWLGITSKYFLFSVASDLFEKGVIKKYGDSAVVKGELNLILNPGSKQSFKLALFTGPKEYKLLKSFGYKFEKSIDFGVFSFLAIPMLNLMNFFYKFVHNYGVAIIILTILIKIVTYPLTIKSMTSMKKMQLIQPEIQKIREKFKGDPQKMNAAMMELYKKYGVNPMGGCLPMLIQIPIFFALYKALLVSIELKGSPFFGWITDLSAKDPYYITPILMGISMFVQQKMTPQAGDPTQQKLFMFMPIIFTFLFLNFPSGLVIYWLTNNLLSILQQYLINKKIAS